MAKHAREIDPGPILPTMELRNDKGDVAIVNAAPEFDGYDDDKVAVRAHERAKRDHGRMLVDWAKRGFVPVEAEKPAEKKSKA